MNAKILRNVVFSSNEFIKERNYWMSRLSGVTTCTCFPKKNIKKVYPSTIDMLYQKFFFSDDISKKLLLITKGSEYGLFTIFLTGLVYLLHRLSNINDVTILTPIFKQEDDELYINELLFIRNHIDGEMTGYDLLVKTKQAIIEANDNMNFPFEDIVNDLKITVENDSFSQFRIMALCKNIHKLNSYNKMQFDNIIIYKIDGNVIQYEIGYKKDLFDKKFIYSLHNYYMNFFKIFVHQPHKKIYELDILSVPEKEKNAIEYNKSWHANLKKQSIFNMINNNMHYKPDVIALVSDYEQLTYKELDLRSSAVALMLNNYGIRHGDIIGLLMERSIDLFASIVGVLKVQGICLPIDNNYPRQRVEEILQDSNTKFLIIGNRNIEEFDFQGLTVPIMCNKLSYPIEKFSLIEPISSKPIFVVYTSGSTGKPKGILISYRGIANHIHAIIEELKLLQSDRFCHNFSIGFIVSIWLFLGPLYMGSSLRIYSEKIISNIIDLIQKIILDDISILEIIPSVLKTILKIQEGKTVLSLLKSLRMIILTGETIYPSLVNDFYKYYKIPLINAYGQTECSDDTLFFKIPYNTETTKVPIGRPSRNTQAYIFNIDRQIQPEDIQGEIYIGGDGVAIGYLNDPKLTSEKFLHNPFKLNDIIFRTGDLGLWSKDADIELVGRTDNQIKLRGHRLELEEIEAQLLRYNEIIKATAIAWENEDSEPYICAYYVSNRELKIAELREFLFKSLPDYMIPAYFMKLEKIPLTPNGKVDKKVLPIPQVNGGKDNIAPRDEVEKKLVEIWSEVLGITTDKISINRSFFELGGHSLKVVILIAKIAKEFDVKLSVPTLFRISTIEHLSRHIKQSYEKQRKVLHYSEDQEYYGLSTAQKNMYILNQFSEYHIPTVWKIEGNFTKEKAEKIFREIIRRHDSLRTSFRIINGEPVQMIHEQVEFKIQYYETSENNIDWQHIRLNFFKEFDLTKPPLLNTGVIKIKEGYYYLLINIHHLISDGMSIALLLKEIRLLYGSEQMPELCIRYIDYVLTQNKMLKNGELNNQEMYWFEKFSGVISPLCLPTDYPRPTVQNYEGDNLVFEISSDVIHKLKEITLENNMTLFMIFMSAFYILLNKYTGQEDIVIGTLDSGRHYDNTENMIGVFINTLAIRICVKSDRTIDELLNIVKSLTLEAYENSLYPFRNILNHIITRKDLSRNPLFDVMLIMHEFDLPNSRLGELQILPSNNKIDLKQVAQQDLELVITQNGSELFFNLLYCKLLFKTERIARLIKHYKNILQNIVLNRSQTIINLKIIDEDEEKLLLTNFSNNIDFNADKSLHGLFQDQVNKTPDHIAIILQDHQLTYRELNRRANHLARKIRHSGIKENDIIATMANPSTEMIIGILGILKAGSAYLPIDMDSPEERIKYVLNDSQAGLLLTTYGKSERHKDIICDIQTINISSDSINYYEKKDIDYCKNLSSLSYVIYTSGTTGIPKGVPIEHRQVVTTLCCRKSLYRIADNEVALQLFSYAFDGFVTSFFTPIISGAKVVLAGEEELSDVTKIRKTILYNNITHVICIPSLAGIIMDNITPNEAKSIRIITLAGDEVLPSHIKATVSANKNIEIVIEYGVTEAAVMQTIHRNQQKSRIIKIGKPTWNVILNILNESNLLQPLGIDGEICITGIGVSRGYLNEPEHTAEKFIPNKYYSGDIMYKTGDIARWLKDGNLQFLGRMDNQVKIRGYRIELGEIESQLSRFPGIKLVVAIAFIGKDGNRFLCVYYTTKNDEEIKAYELRNFLSTVLPEYMIPAHFIRLKKIPLTEMGKIDRKALPEPTITNESEYITSRDDVDMKLIKIWSSVLEIEEEKIGIDSNFFELGGQSLRAIVVLSEINKEFNIQLPLVDLFKSPTIRTIADAIRCTNGDYYACSNDNGIILLKKGGDNKKKFFFIHDGSGEVDCYRKFCDFVDLVHTCWGIRVDSKPNMYGPQNLTIENIAKNYIKKIKNIQQQGPYYFASWSLGGIIAFEVVKQLESIDDKVSFLALIDTFPPHQKKYNEHKEFNLQTEIQFIQKFFSIVLPNNIIENSSDVNSIWLSVIEDIKSGKISKEKLYDSTFIIWKKIIPNFNTIDYEKIIYYLNIIRSINNACNMYEPSNKIYTPLHFFSASKSKVIDYVDIWNNYCHNPIKKYIITGDHFSIFEQPQIIEFANLIRKVIRNLRINKNMISRR